MKGVEQTRHDPGIYVIRNTVTGLVYVGSSTAVRRRLLRHRLSLNACKHENPRLQRAWSKYGEAAFECSALEYVDRADLIAAEQRHIDAAGAADPERGYNVIPFADRRELAPETLQRMSASLKGKNTGKSPTTEVRQRISAALAGRPLSAEALEKRRATLAARTDEEKRAAAAKVSAALTGKKKSPEARANMGAARKKFWTEWRAKKALGATTEQHGSLA